MHCEPEPVEALDVNVAPSNGTVSLSWRPAVDVRHVLLYEIRYVPVAQNAACTLGESTVYLPAVSGGDRFDRRGARARLLPSLARVL